MTRSLKVAQQHIERVRLSLQRNRYISQQDLADDLGLSRDTVSKFFNGKSISNNNFKEICRKLGLNLEEIADFSVENDDNLSSPKFCNLPRKDYSKFIGRDEELKQLLQYISPNYRQHITVVEGIGGVGKTALVLEAAYRCCEVKNKEQVDSDIPSFDAIIFTSAKDSYLVPFGILKRPIREATLRDIFEVIAEQLDKPAIKQATDTKEQVKLVYKCLSKQSTLLIIDNIETVTVEDKAEILAFLADVPISTQAIITTREKILLYNSIRLESLSKEESFELIRQQAAENKQNPITFTEQQCQRLYKRFGGIPVALIYAVGQKASGYSMMRIIVPDKQLPEPKEPLPEDIARFCFDGSVKPLYNQPEHKILMSIALCPKSPVKDLIIQVSGIQNTFTVNKGLSKLSQFSLIKEQEGRFKMLPLTREYALDELNANPSFKAEAYDRWVKWYLNFTEQYGGKDWDGWRANYDDYLEPEWSNIKQVLEWCAVNNRYRDVKQLWINIDTYIDIEGNWRTRRNWWSWLIVKSQQFNDLATYVKALIEKSWTLILMPGNHKEEALNLLNQASQLRSQADEDTQIRLVIYFAVFYRSRNINKSLQYLEEAESLLEKSNIEGRDRERHKMMIAYYRAEISYKQENLDEAQKLFEEIISTGKQISWQRLTNYAENWLADILIDRGQLTEAEQLLEAGIFMATQNKEERRIGHYQATYARLEKARNNREKSCGWGKQALYIFRKQDIQEDAAEMEKLLKEWGCEELESC
jgi:LuxR family glucitol operon transcriptional activator